MGAMEPRVAPSVCIAKFAEETVVAYGAIHSMHPPASQVELEDIDLLANSTKTKTSQTWK